MNKERKKERKKYKSKNINEHPSHVACKKQCGNSFVKKVLAICC